VVERRAQAGGAAERHPDLQRPHPEALEVAGQAALRNRDQPGPGRGPDQVEGGGGAGDALPDLHERDDQREAKESVEIRGVHFCGLQACAEYLKTAQTHGHKWIRLLQHEREQRQRLQEMVETLAQQHSKLEQAANAHTNRPAGEPRQVAAVKDNRILTA
jgi:hypothetical protein